MPPPALQARYHDLKKALVTTNVFKWERIQWNHMLFVTVVDTTFQISFPTSCTTLRCFSIKIQPWRLSLTKLWITFAATHLHVHKMSRDDLTAHLTLFSAIVFYKLYFTIRFSFIFTSSLFNFLLDSPFLCFITNAIIVIKMTSYSNSVLFKSSEDRLQSFNGKIDLTLQL